MRLVVVTMQDALMAQAAALLRENETLSQALSHAEGRSTVMLPPPLAHRAGPADEAVLSTAASLNVRPPRSPAVSRCATRSSAEMAVRVVDRADAAVDVPVAAATALLEDQMCRLTAVVVNATGNVADFVSALVWHPVLILPLHCRSRQVRVFSEAAIQCAAGCWIWLLSSRPDLRVLIVCDAWRFFMSVCCATLPAECECAVHGAA